MAQVITADEIDKLAEELAELLAARLGARRGGLRRRVARAGRGLPGRVRAQILMVAEAQELAQSPHLAKRVDSGAVHRAHAEAAAHLTAIDPRERRIHMALGIGAGLVVNLILLALALAFLWHLAGR